MSLTRRMLLAAGAAAGGLPAHLGCATGTGRAPSAPAVKFGDPVSITFWHTQTGANEKALAEAVTKFNLHNGKNITLRSEFQGNAQQVFQKTMVALQAGSPPDTAVAFESMVHEYARAGAVVTWRTTSPPGPPPSPGRAGPTSSPPTSMGGAWTPSGAACWPSPSPAAWPCSTTTRTSSAPPGTAGRPP